MDIKTHMRRLILAIIFWFAATLPASAQLSLPYTTFVSGQVISSSQFTTDMTQISANALNRTAPILTGSLLFSPDNTLDIGASGATRPRDFWLGRNASIAGTLGVTGVTTHTGFTQFGTAFTPAAVGLTSFQAASSFPAMNFYNSGGGADAKWSQFIINTDGGWSFRFANDAGTVVFDALVINRTAVSSAVLSSNATLNFTATPTAPQISFNNATSNWIQWSTAGVAPPAFTTRSTGTKLVAFPNIGASSVDYAVGIDANTMWFSVPTQSSAYSFKWYGGTTVVGILDGGGSMTVGANLTVNNIATITGTTTTGGLTNSGVHLETAVISPPALSADVNDYTPTGLSATTTVRIDPGGANRNITGLAAQSGGREIRLCDVAATGSGFFLTTVVESTSSLAANRFAIQDNWGPGQCATFWYDTTSSRWRLS